MGCACTEEERGGCGIFDLHLLLPVPEKAVNPVTDAWVDVHDSNVLNSLAGFIVLNAELKSMNRMRAYVLADSRWFRM